MSRQVLRVRAAAVLAAVAGAVSLLYAQAPADLVLTGGKVVTVDDRFTIAQAVAVRGDRVVAVGSSQDVARLAGPATRRIDLRGRTVVPGLIDNHMHLLRAATTWQLELRWDGVYTRRQALDQLRARAQAVGPGQWVFNFGGWAVAQFTDDARPFTREELDRVAPDNPVALQESYYRVFLNSRALEAFGIRPGAPDPEDFVKGSVKRDPDGHPTGRIQGDMAATRSVQARLPRLPAAQLEASTRALIADMNRAGLTSFGVAGCLDDVMAVFQRLKAQKDLGVRVFCIDGAGATTPEQATRAIEQIGRMRLFDGDEFIDRVAFGESVYQPLHTSMFQVTAQPPAADLEQWRRIAAAIAEAGLPLHVHANLTGTIDAFLDQIEAVNRVHPVRALRWQLAHLNQVNGAHLERMRRLGVSASVHPWSVINGDLLREEFGEVAAMDLAPFDVIQKSGVPWGIGSDGSAANQYLPMTALHFAVTGKLPSGRTVSRHTISREDALVAHTRQNAYFLFREADLGAIQPGRLADLVVLDRDYLTVPADQIKDVRPVMTIVGGRVVFDAAAANTTP